MPGQASWRGSSGLHLKSSGAIKVKGVGVVVRVCGENLHSRQRNEHEQWQEIKDQVEELWAVRKEANDEAAKIIRDQYVKSNKDGEASGFPSWVLTGRDRDTH